MMNKYQIILFLLVFSISFKVWADNDLKNTPPQAVREAMQDVVFILIHHPMRVGQGSGFIIRDDKDRAILVTAYHLLEGFIEKQYPVTVLDAYGKKLKIKKVLSYSTKIDTAFLELESYERKGLKLANSHFGDSGDAFVLGFFGNQRHLLKGAHLKTSSRDLFNIIIDRDFEIMGGFSGGPVLNEYGEVMGMLVSGHGLYKYANVVKNTNMRALLDSPNKKTSAIDQILYDFTYQILPFRYLTGRGNIFSDKSNFQRLQAMSDEGSFNAQKILKELDKIQLAKLNVSVLSLAVFALGTSVLLQAETLSVIDVLLVAPPTAFFGYASFNYCTDVLTHFKNKTLSRTRKN